MRCATAALVLALLLPNALVTGGPSGAPPPHPLTFLGGGERPANASAALVVDVYDHALRADEYVVLANLAGAPLDLSGWSITDGEGVLVFPPGSIAATGARIVVAQNSTAYFEDILAPADFRYLAGNATPMAASGSFQLNNAGDEVILKDASDATADVFVYGSSPYAGPGWTGTPAAAQDTGYVARRDFVANWRDTDSSADWDLLRVRSLGQSEFAPAAFDFAGTALAFVTPDAKTWPLRELLANATSTVDLCVYTLSNSDLVNGLNEATAHGVRVRVLLEGAPVGGIDTDEWAEVQRLRGADIHFMVDNTSLDIQERYRYVHAKYAILDHVTVLVESENWGPSAFPTWDATGSRGWAVALTDGALAAYFDRVFDEDFDARRRDVYTLAEMTVNPVSPPPWSGTLRSVVFPPLLVTGPFHVVPVVGPDTTLADATILGALRSATRTIHAEIFYAYVAWGPFSNPYLDTLVAAARRGVQVRLLLDSSSYNVDDTDPNDNDNTVSYLNGVAAAEGLDLQARLVDRGLHGLSIVHNKGFVVDGRTVLVSSVNWNRNSATANREAGLLITNGVMAAYFDRVFAWDWKDDFTPPTADAGPDRAVAVGTVVTFSGRGSSDDVGVVNWTWDLDGDGADDAWGPEVTRPYDQEGTFVVRLRVADADGNAAIDNATVSVRPPADVHSEAWILLAAFAGTVVALVLVRRRRQRLSKPPRM